MYLIIGSGRTAAHFSHYFSLKNIEFLSWDRKSGSAADLAAQLKRSSKVLLLISDTSILPFYQKHLSGLKQQIIHTSGALDFPNIVGAHPLMTFGPKLYELPVYEKMMFALSPGIEFSEIFPELKNNSFAIPQSAKALYHAWAVYSGNFATLLWKEAFDGFEKLGVPGEAVQIYLEQVLENVFKNPQQALTGPLARKDSKMISKHLAVLPEPAFSIYQSFVQTYAPEIQKETFL